MKLLIVNTHMETGGIRQSLLNMLDNIRDFGFDIDLQILKYDKELIEQSEQLKGINVLRPIKILNACSTSFSKQKSFVGRILKIIFWCVSRVLGGKAAIDLVLRFVPETQEYDMAISYSNDIWTSNGVGFIGGCNDYVIKKVNAGKKIAWVHNEPQKLGFTYRTCKKTYRDFEKLVNVSFACKKMFDEIIPEYKYKSEVVYNMFNIERITGLSDTVDPYDNGKFNIITAARLYNQQKRIDKIIECCVRLKADGITNFQWHIIGDGPDREMLKSLSKEQGMEDIVLFDGRQDNPYPYMRYADLFVLTSDYEAYGMVLTESIITGTPVVCTDFPAAREVVENNKNGIITAMDTDSIFNTVKKLIDQPEIIRSMKDFIEQNKYSNEFAINQLKDVLGVK